MAIPDFQTIMLPLLHLAADKEPHSLRDATEALAKHFGLSVPERTTLLPSGRQAIFDNRVGWARTYMKKAGLLDTPCRGVFQITARGFDVLKVNPTRIDIGVLGRFPEFRSFRSLRHDKESEVPSATDGSTPEETLEDAYESMRVTLEASCWSASNRAPRGFSSGLWSNCL